MTTIPQGWNVGKWGLATWGTSERIIEGSAVPGQRSGQTATAPAPKEGTTFGRTGITSG